MLLELIRIRGVSRKDSPDLITSRMRIGCTCEMEHHSIVGVDFDIICSYTQGAGLILPF